MTYKAIIYDCDGVMFDSFEANYSFYDRIMVAMDRKLNRNDSTTMQVLHTYSHRYVLAHLFPEEPEQSRSLALAAAIDYRELVPLMKMEEGFRETLERLYRLYHLAICTNRSTSMETVLQNFDLARYFRCVMTASLVSNPKPHPEPLLKVLGQLGLAPREALFIGDSEVDSQAAASAGIPFIAYKSNLPALARIDDHREIFAILEQD